jgi:DNA polymerase IV
LVDIGNQIKHDIKESLGEYVTVNIGIAPNRFLAMIAAGIEKPDGLDVMQARDI